ncbi:MAG: Maf family protein [Rhodanobacteraceae bacterium]
MVGPSFDLVLASGSPYRRDLLRRLTGDFRISVPAIDETMQAGENACALAGRLAREKALAVAARSPDALVIGSDQAAECNGRLLGKPGTADAAEAQLAECSGRTVIFYTALCLADTRAASPKLHAEADITRVVFRKLSSAEITRYVEREQPLDCAGSFKIEGLGVSLFERIEATDPTALIGMPLVALCRLLRAAGYAIP